MTGRVTAKGPVGDRHAALDLRTTPPAEVEYPSPALPHSELAWKFFADGEHRAAGLVRDGLLDFGDGVEDIVASAFWHLSRWEERPGSTDRSHGRFPAAAALGRSCTVPRWMRWRPVSRGARVCDQHRRQFTVALTHDVDSPWRWYGRRA